MQDNPQSELTPTEIKHLLQEAILHNYPNPDRRGCPDPPAQLKIMAAARLPHEHPLWHHVTHCSPCYQEFLEYRAAVLTRRRDRRLLAAIGAGTIAAAALIAGIWLSTARPAPKVPSPIARRTDPASGTLTAVLNMQASPTRGAEGTAGAASDLQRLPRGRMSPLLIYLPFGTDPGTYKVDLLRDEKDSTPLATFSGYADIRDGLTVLQASPDLSRFGPGTYLLLVSREGGGPWACRFVLF